MTAMAITLCVILVVMGVFFITLPHFDDAKSIYPTNYKLLFTTTNTATEYTYNVTSLKYDRGNEGGTEREIDMGTSINCIYITRVCIYEPDICVDCRYDFNGGDIGVGILIASCIIFCVYIICTLIYKIIKHTIDKYNITRVTPHTI